MWCFLKDELLNDIVPTIEKFTDESDKVKAEELVKEIDAVLVNSESGYALNRLYSFNPSFKKKVEYFLESESPYVALFGVKVHWLLTKGPHFYSDD